MLNINDKLGPRRFCLDGLEIQMHSGESGCFCVHLQELMWVMSHTALFVLPSRNHVQAKCILYADVTYPLEVVSWDDGNLVFKGLIECHWAFESLFFVDGETHNNLLTLKGCDVTFAAP